MTSIAITLARCAFQGYWAGGESIDEVFNQGPLFPCLPSSFFILSFPFVFFAFFFSIPVAPLFFVLSPLFAHGMERNSDIRQASMKPHRFRSISASSINRALSLSLFLYLFLFSLCAHRYSPEREYLGREGEEGGGKRRAAFLPCADPCASRVWDAYTHFPRYSTSQTARQKKDRNVQ